MGTGEPPLVSEGDVDRDQCERDEDREDRALDDLAAEARRDVLHAERLRVDLLREPVREPILLRGLELLDPDLEVRVRLRAGQVAASLDDGVVRARGRGSVPHVSETGAGVANVT